MIAEEFVRPGYVKAPPFYLKGAELRALAEHATLPLSWPALVKAPRGDGHRVLVLPGFNAGDRSTATLRRYLTCLGYETHEWGLGRNFGPTPRVLAGLNDLVEALAAPTGTTVSVIGWSLGGLYAREIARENPQRIRYVATLGSPFRMRPGDASTLSALLEKRFERNFQAAAPLPREEDREAVPVPTSAIYSRTDGFVRPELCIDTATDRHENIRVRGSHMGLVINPAVLYALADRLHHVSAGQIWRSFRASVRAPLLYPRPDSWDGLRYQPSK